MILLSFPAVPTGAEETETIKDDGYKYAVTIEFGPMTFYYDYGVWDTNEMRYKSGDASKDPANGTTAGYPGWYGFDGTANYISVKYSNGNESDAEDKNRNLSVSLEYRALTTAEATDGNVIITGITMDFFSDKALTTPFVFDNDGKTFKVPHTPVDSEDQKTVIYVSLSGVPKDNSNNYYMSPTFTPVGMLTIRIGEISD